MRSFVLLVLVLLAMVLQATLLNFLQVYGIKPDLILLLIIFNSFLQGPREGAFLGCLGGLLQDMFTGNYIGLNMLSKGITGYLVGLFEGKLYKDNTLIMISITMVSTIFCQLIYYGLLFFLGISVAPDYAFYRVILPLGLYNSLIVPIFYGWFRRSNQKGWLRHKES